MLRNLGDGRFADVTRQAGIQLAGSGLGCAAGDFDNDGHTDLAVCLSDGVRLLRNGGDGKFADVTEKVGIRREKGCVGVTFVDYDHDGDLDLYVTSAATVGRLVRRTTFCGVTMGIARLRMCPRKLRWVCGDRRGSGHHGFQQ